MSALRVVVFVLGVAGAVGVLGSVIRTVVLPRAIPARLARVAFLGVRALLLARLRITRSFDYRTRDRVFALQAPLGLFAQLITWTSLLYICFAGLFWSLSHAKLTGRAIAGACELAGSSMSTLGFDKPSGILVQLLAFASAAVGLTLLALVITYLPSLYGAFARREALITKLAVRAGRLPTGVSLLVHSWKLERFERLEEVWDAWEDWFIDLGESHTTFPQLGFFRSPHPDSHWVLAAEAVLDGAALLRPSATRRTSRAASCASTPESTPWQPSPTSSAFRMSRPRRRPRSPSYRSSSPPRGANSLPSRSRSSRASRRAGAPFVRCGPGMSRCSRCSGGGPTRRAATGARGGMRCPATARRCCGCASATPPMDRI